MTQGENNHKRESMDTASRNRKLSKNNDAVMEITKLAFKNKAELISSSYFQIWLKLPTKLLPLRMNYFEHLPKITEENLTVFIDKELDWFTDLMKGAMKSTKTLDEAIDLACGELHRNNPYLVKAIRGAVYGVAGEIEDEVEEGLEWRAGLAALPGILAILRLIDRALQAQLLEAKLLEKSASRGKEANR